MNGMKLQITIDSSSGFCFGVTEAIEKAEKALAEIHELYCLGEIVHNDEEVARLENLGMRTIEREQLEKLRQKTILFRAHGEPPSSYATAQLHDNTIIDASCPIIKKLQLRIKEAWQKGYYIIIFGKPEHPEVIGLNGQIDNQALIIQKKQDISLEHLPEKIALYSQTTQSIEAFYDIVNYLKTSEKLIHINDTICRRVSNRQPQLRKFAASHKRIVFVGGKNSSNGKVLFDVCKSINEFSFFVSHPEEIKAEWFHANDTVGITGATSTPRWLMEKVKEYLENIKSQE